MKAYLALYIVFGIDTYENLISRFLIKTSVSFDFKLKKTFFFTEAFYIYHEQFYDIL